MPLNLAQYEAVYNQKKELAITVAEGLIAKMDVRSTDIPLNECSVFTSNGIEESKGWMKTVLDITSCIMFSSGYWHTYTCRLHRDRKLRIVHDISIMTAQEREDNLTPNADGLYIKGEPAKSETATPAQGESECPST
jgi:hypothetical protein